MQTLFTFLQKPATLMRRSIVLRLPLWLVFPAWSKSCVERNWELDQYRVLEKVFYNIETV